MYLYDHFAVSKMIGWQLCSDVTYPLTPRGFPPLGPVLFTLRLQKLDKSLKQYLMEAAYTFVPQVDAVITCIMSGYGRFVHFIRIFCQNDLFVLCQRNSWMPQEATLLLFLGTPQSTFPRDVSLDLNFNQKKLILKIIHPLKNILIQGFTI